MGTTLTRLPLELATILGLPPFDLRHRAQHLRREGAYRGAQWAPNTPADSEDVARLVLSAMPGTPQVFAPQELRATGGITASEPVAWRDLILALPETPFLEVLRRIIDGLRHPDARIADEVLALDEVRLYRAAGETWVELDLLPAAPRRPPRRTITFANRPAPGTIPAWSKLPGFVRTTTLTVGTLLAVVPLLGRLEHRPEWPKHSSELESGPPDEAGGPLSDPLVSRANAGSRPLPTSRTQDSGGDTHKQASHPETGLAGEDLCPGSTCRRRRTA